MKRGFTLIELLVVIAILGILSAVVLVAINPLQKINQANDSKVKSDIGQVSTALQSYFTNKQTYPTVAQYTAGQLVTAKELTVMPAPPTASYTYTYAVPAGGCLGTIASPCTSFSLSGTLLAPALSTNTLWCFRSSTGTAGEGTTCTAP